MRRPSSLLWLLLLWIGLPGALVAQEIPKGISLPPSLNFATSPSPVGSGARAQGQGIAFIAVADDATAASHNPGGLLQVLEPEASIVGSYIRRLEQQDSTQPGMVVENQTLEGWDFNYLSLTYPFELFRRNVVVSLNVQRLFDLEGKTDMAAPFTTVNGIQRVHSRQTGGLFTISPAVAVEITPSLAVGIAFNIWPDLFDNEWQQQVTVQGEGSVSSGNRIVPFRADGQIHERFAFQGFNVTGGVLWQVSSSISLGGVIRTPFTARVSRTHTSALTVTLLDGSPPVSSALRFRETLDMAMPLAYGIGIAVRPVDRLRLAFDVSRVHWSDFRLQASTRDQVLLVEHGAPSGKGRAVLRGAGDDTTAIRLGAQYLWSEPQLAFRVGLFYDPEPGEHGTDDFWGMSLGAGMTLQKIVFDLAYMFRTGTIRGPATETAVSQHGIVASVIYHF